MSEGFVHRSVTFEAQTLIDVRRRLASGGMEPDAASEGARALVGLMDLAAISSGHLTLERAISEAQDDWKVLAALLELRFQNGAGRGIVERMANLPPADFEAALERLRPRGLIAEDTTDGFHSIYLTASGYVRAGNGTVR